MKKMTNWIRKKLTNSGQQLILIKVFDMLFFPQMRASKTEKFLAGKRLLDATTLIGEIN